MNESQFKEALQQLGYNITDQQLFQFHRYAELLISWNKKFNLTAITDERAIYLKHFYDCATLIKVCHFEANQTLCDIGSGAGFPGLVIKILFPLLEITLIDALQKRVNFLQTVIDDLELEKITVCHERIEEYGIKRREHFDFVTARAVAPLSILLEYAIPLLKVEGRFLVMKANISQEIEEAHHALQVLKALVEEKQSFLLPHEESIRTLLVIRKKEKTAKQYPRRYADIKKKSL